MLSTATSGKSIKHTMRVIHTHKQATIKRTDTNTGEGVERPKCWHTASGEVMVQPLSKVQWQFLIKVNTDLPHDPASTILQIYSRELKACPHEDLYANVCNSIIHKIPKLETIQTSIKRWMNKQNVIHPYNGTLVSNKKEHISDTH